MNERKPTKRERKEEAKRRRMEELRRRQRRARLRKLYTYGIVAAVVVGLGAVVLISRASNERAKKRAAELAAAAGCEPPRTFPQEGREHTQEVTEPVNYGTEPPTSGRHFGQWGPTGILTQAHPDTMMVHNLEHGHVGIQYQEGAISDEILEQLKEVVREQPEWVILAPRQNRDSAIAFTAWQVLQKCAEPTEQVVEVAREFVKRFRDQGPESVPGDPTPEEPPPDGIPPEESPQPDAPPEAPPEESPDASPDADATAESSPEQTAQATATATPG